jgi:hypothetical protein
VVSASQTHPQQDLAVFNLFLQYAWRDWEWVVLIENHNGQTPGAVAKCYREEGEEHKALLERMQSVEGSPGHKRTRTRQSKRSR